LIFICFVYKHFQIRHKAKITDFANRKLNKLLIKHKNKEKI